jgi:hypothetical protein
LAAVDCVVVITLDVIKMVRIDQPMAVGLEGAFGLLVRQFVGRAIGAVVDPAGDDGAVRVAFLKINASPFLY